MEQKPKPHSGPTQSKQYLKRRGDLIGPYEVQSLLGAGMEGTVYRTVDLRTGDICSVKLIRGRRMEGEAAHTARYYQALGQVEGLKRFREWGVVDAEPSVGRRPWLAFDYIPGQTLPRFLAATPSVALRPLIRELCEVVTAIHRYRLGVGDFDRGRNVLVESGTGRLVLCDLDAGVAGARNRDRHADLAELASLSRLMYRTSRLPMDAEVATAFNEARSVADVCRRLAPLAVRSRLPARPIAQPP